jgi:diacylglycerol kinase (ATP)
MTPRALLLVNRNARRGQDDLSRAIAQLRELNVDLIEAPSRDPHSIAETIRRYAKQVDMVIIGGGDGTLNAAIDGLLETQLPLGILPLGTANDLARTLGIPTALSDACKVISGGHSERIDLGWVNGKHFFNVASLGLSVKITQQLSREAKRRWGIFAYAIAACQVLLKSVPFTAEIHANGESIHVRTVQIAIGNGRYYGGGMTVAADAAIDDQRLDLYSLEIDHWWQMLALLPNMRSGTHSSWSFVRSLASQSIELKTHRRHSINTDGEITTGTPALFRVVPKAISVLVPKA